MAEKRLMSRQESRSAYRDVMEKVLAAKYPNAKRHAIRKAATASMRQAFKDIPGGKVYVVIHPASMWQRIKKAIAPSWFIKRFPVRSVERYG